MNKDIIENNKLIAKFMGWDSAKYYCMRTHGHNPFDWQKLGSRPSHCFSKCSCSWGDQINFHYHSLWEWLMPVVEKIESLMFNSETELNNGILVRYMEETCMIDNYYIEGNVFIMPTTDKDYIYRRVVNFIKWYNGREDN